MLDTFICPRCGKNSFEDLNQVDKEKTANAAGDIFDGQLAVAGTSSSRMRLVQCKTDACLYTGIFLEKSLSVLIEVKE